MDDFIEIFVSAALKKTYSGYACLKLNAIQNHEKTTLRRPQTLSIVFQWMPLSPYSQAMRNDFIYDSMTTELKIEIASP